MERPFSARSLYVATLLLAAPLAVVGLDAPPAQAQARQENQQKNPASPAESRPAPLRIAGSDVPLQGPPWIGVALAKPDDAPGVVIERVMARTPAARAGLRAGDRIISIDGQSTATPEKIQLLTGGHRPGDQMRVQLLRDGEARTVIVTLEEKPSARAMVERQLVGRPAPDFEVRVLSEPDATRSLRHWRGKPTVVEFWATWCGPCRIVSRDLAALKEEHGDDVHIVAVSSESPEIIRGFLKKHASPYPVGHDVGARGHDDFLVSTFPMVVLLDAEHRVSAVILGAGQRRALESKLKTLVGEAKQP